MLLRRWASTAMHWYWPRRLVSDIHFSVHCGQTRSALSGCAVRSLLAVSQEFFASGFV
jgi:hypothetical protein